MNTKKNLLFFSLFLALALISFWPIFSQKGAVVPTWDWNLPLYPRQAWEQFRNQFNLWEERAEGGFFYPVRGELLYWLAFLPFSFLFSHWFLWFWRGLRHARAHRI